MPMTHTDRVVAALTHAPVDRPPVLACLTITGARACGVSIRDYFEGPPERVVEAQLAMQRAWGHDALIGFYSAAHEATAYGSLVQYFPDGPPLVGRPALPTPEAIDQLRPPPLGDAHRRVVQVVEGLAASAVAPVVAVVVAPFSMAVMQLGYARWLDVLAEQPARAERLVAINLDFARRWARAQAEAGAAALVYFEPLASPGQIPTAWYDRLGAPALATLMSDFAGVRVVHLASEPVGPRVDDLVAWGATAGSLSAKDDLPAVVAAARGRLALVGGLDALADLRGRPPAAIQARVAQVHRGLGLRSGWLVSDHHGEIPWQVGDAAIAAFAASARGLP